MALRKDEVRRIWKDFFEDLYNADPQEQVTIHMCGFNHIQRGEEPIRRTEVQVRVGKLKKGKAAGKDEVTGEMVKHEDYMLVDWIWRLCNMAFESGVVPEDWKSVDDKGESAECKNYRGIRLLKLVRKIYAGILLDRVC